MADACGKNKFMLLFFAGAEGQKTICICMSRCFISIAIEEGFLLPAAVVQLVCPLAPSWGVPLIWYVTLPN